MKKKLFLQIFADGYVGTNAASGVNTSYNTNVTGDTGLSAEMKTFYDKNLIDLASAKMIHSQFAVKRPIPANGGKTIEFRKYSTLPEVTAPLTEGVTPDGQKLTVSTINATVAQYGAYVSVSDALILTAIDNNVMQATKKLADQAANKIDKLDRDILIGGTNVHFAGGKTRASLESTDKITVTEIYNCITDLKDADAPTVTDDGMYVCLLHPDVAKDLMLNSDWKEMHKYDAPDAMFKGYIGEIAGCKFFESTNCKVYKGENLAGDVRTLAVDQSGGYSGAITSVAFDGATVAADALKGRSIIINGVSAVVTGNTASAISFASTDFGTIADDAVIYPGEGGKTGDAVYACVFLGADAYAVTEVEGGGLQHIVKPLGAGDDPLNQRSTIGWKLFRAGAILVPEYVLRFECGASNGASTKGN